MQRLRAKWCCCYISCAADQIIITREFFDQRQEFNLIYCQNISVHADENIVEKNEPSAAGNWFAGPMSAG